jgi:hypothetical protein
MWGNKGGVTEAVQDELIVELEWFVTEAVQDELIVELEWFVTEAVRDELIVELEWFVTEAVRDELLVELEWFVTEAVKDELIVELELFVTEAVRDELIVELEWFVTSRFLHLLPHLVFNVKLSSLRGGKWEIAFRYTMGTAVLRHGPIYRHSTIQHIYDHNSGLYSG